MSWNNNLKVEYWLQKKQLGGWSHVTWYETLEEAQTNLKRVGDSSGYSWRVVEAKIVIEQLLDEVTDIAKPEVELPLSNWGTRSDRPWIAPDNKSEGWGSQPGVDPENNTGDNPRASERGNGAGEDREQHRMTGKIWLVHHVRKERARVNPNEVAKYEAEGYEKGGPKVAFR